MSWSGVWDNENMNNKTIKSWAFVTVQAVLLVALIFLTDGNQYNPANVVLTGKIIQIFGAVILLISFYDLRKSLTALPMPKDNGVLQVHGLYRFVRHPMYVGVLVLSLGIAVAGGNLEKYVLVICLYILFSYKARYEEKLLAEKYSGYEKYMKNTPRFLPKFW